MIIPFLRRRLRTAGVFVFAILAVEFLDELVQGVHGTSRPLIQQELGLTYVEIGLLFSLPQWFGIAIDPLIGLYGDTWRRRGLILLGGVGVTLDLIFLATSQTFLMLLTTTILFAPASGAFVNLSQAALMDSDPPRHDFNMSRWAFAGSLAWVVGSVGVSAALALGISWRVLFAIVGMMAALVTLLMAFQHIPRTREESDEGELPLLARFRAALDSLRRPDVARWLILLEFANLMLDVLHGYLALYMVDVAGATPAQAALAVGVWTIVGLAGDFLVIYILKRVDGLVWLRFAAAAELILFVAFLLVPIFWVKLVLIGLVGFFNSGWYSIMQGRLYTALPGQSGAMMTIHTIFGLVGTFVPLAVGAAAERFGLGAAIWLLCLGSVALLVGLPRRKHATV